MTSVVTANLATVYAGCEMANNRISQFSGHIIGEAANAARDYPQVIGRDYAYFNDETGKLIEFQRSGDENSFQSSQQCCHAAFNLDCLGWEFESYQGVGDCTCYCVQHAPGDDHDWAFGTISDGLNSADITVGNGPNGVPVFSGYET